MTPRCHVDAGVGNDVIFGSGHADLLDGGAGDDLIYARGGNDTVIGSDGRDRLFGDGDYDVLYGDLDDLDLRGGSGSDVIKLAGFDPSRLTIDVQLLKKVVNSGINGYSLTNSKDGERVTIKNLRVLSVEIVDGETTIRLKADIRYQKTHDFPQYSASGRVEFELKPVIHVEFADVYRRATIALTNVKVTEVNINNVPNWVDNHEQVRKFLTAKLSQQPPLNATNVLSSHLATGGNLGPMIVV